MSSSAISGQRMLITGGTKGIGLAVALGAKARGAQVIVVGRNPDRLHKAKTEHGLLVLEADLSDPAKAEGVIEDSVAQLGGLDTLVNNAGLSIPARLGQVKADDFQRVLATNVITPALLAQAALPHFEAAGKGSIANISSVAGTKGYEGGTIYAASKFALRGMGQCWQAELRRKDVRVFTFSPSYVHTGFSSGADAQGERPHHLQAEDVALLVLNALELPHRAFAPEMTLFATNPWRDD